MESVVIQPPVPRATILRGIAPHGYFFRCFSRLVKDIHAGIRTEDVLGRSLERIPLYEKLNIIKVDASNITAEEAAE
jgi:hypothetical protein